MRGCQGQLGSPTQGSKRGPRGHGHIADYRFKPRSEAGYSLGQLKHMQFTEEDRRGSRAHAPPTIGRPLVRAESAMSGWVFSGGCRAEDPFIREVRLILTRAKEPADRITT